MLGLAPGGPSLLLAATLEISINNIQGYFSVHSPDTPHISRSNLFSSSYLQIKQIFNLHKFSPATAGRVFMLTGFLTVVGKLPVLVEVVEGHKLRQAAGCALVWCDPPVLVSSWCDFSSHGGGGRVALCSQARVKSNISASAGNISVACLHLPSLVYFYTI